MADELDPEQRELLRIKFRIEYEFVAERNALDSNGPHERSDVREAVTRLTQSERRVLDARVRQRLSDARPLIFEDRKTFDEPYIQPSDLEPACRFDTA